MILPPIDPVPGLPAFAPPGRRAMTVLGAPAELIWVPERLQRTDRPNGNRPAFRRSAAARIVATEAFWNVGGFALTPNRYPFAKEQRILWPTALLRDPDAAMWTAICSWVEAAHGTALVNNIGAAASIARCHAHLTPERLPFLATLRERPVHTDLFDLPPGVTLVAKDVPFCLLGVRGAAGPLANALLRLAEARLTAAWNVVVTDGAAWVYPRRRETPAPHFPYALGAAEIWGRWCYLEDAAFRAATPQDLERALVDAGAEAVP